MRLNFYLSWKADYGLNHGFQRRRDPFSPAHAIASLHIRRVLGLGIVSRSEPRSFGFDGCSSWLRAIAILGGIAVVVSLRLAGVTS
ncbi:MAG: hypothetical protein WAM71_17825, partial [Candidatus Korobacteraceae bacterium]